MNEEEDRPSALLAHSFRICKCRDPGCGIHIISLSENYAPICEVVISQEAMRDMITVMQGVLYEKATLRDASPDEKA